jgi:predicted nucleotidyltransferase
MRTLHDIRLGEKDKKAIEAASRLLKERFPVAQVVLFGSKARGDDDSESDIDLLVLTTRELSWQERDDVTDALFDIEMDCEVVLSTLISTVDAWREGTFSVVPIHDEISEEGIVA